MTRHVDKARLAGTLVSGIAIAFLLFDGTIKVLDLRPVTESFARLGVPASLAIGIGVLELSCTLAYALPRTAVCGAVLLTGYLGGAVAMHLRLLDPWSSHTLFPAYVGALVWGGLALRDRRIRMLWAAPTGCAAGPR